MNGEYLMPRNDDLRVDADVLDVESSDVEAEDAKVWPPTLERKDAGFESGDDVEVKDASADIAVNVTETDDPFRFTLIGGVTGVIDRVQDVVEVGAYTKTLKTRTPKIIKDHEWSQRLGKVLSIKELRPGDPELPKTVANGDPWPKEAGALVADVQLFRKSQAGQEAAERWREYGRDQQFSIGYRVPSGMAVKGRDGVRRIKELDLYEISDVLWGAAPDSTLLPSVLATKVLAGVELESKGVDPEDDETVGETATEAVAEPQDDDSETAENTPQNPQEPVAVEDEEDVEADEDEALPPVTHPPFDDDDEDYDVEEIDFDDPAVDAEAFDAFGDEIASMMDSDVERGDTPETRAPSTSDAGEHTADTVAGADSGPGVAPDNAAAVDAVVDGNNGALTDEPETAAPSTGDEVENVAEKALGAIEDHVSLRTALRTYEGATASEKAVYGPYIAVAAKHAGIDFLLPEELKAIEVQELESKINTAPLGSRTNGENWVEANGGLPPYVRGVVRGLERNGHSRSRAIALAIGAMRRWAKGGGKVNADTRAKAVKALAQWDALKARAAAKRATKSIEPVDENAPEGFEPVDNAQAESETLEAPVDHEEATGTAERKSMMVPFFAGSMEERRSLVTHALMASSELGEFEGRPQIVGMFDDYVIVTVWPDMGAMESGADYSTYKVDFDYDPAEGTVELGKVEKIRITTKQSTTDESDDAEDEVVGILGGLDAEASEGADSVKHAVTMLDLESKAGRVLSASMADSVKNAFETLRAVLKRAGIDVDPETSSEDAVTDETDVDEKSDVSSDDSFHTQGNDADEETERKAIADQIELIRLQMLARTRTIH